MSAETARRVVLGRRVRYDLLGDSRSPSPWPALALAALATLFVIWGAADRDPNLAEAPIGLACWGEFAPFGQVAGLWDATLLPGRFWPSLLWTALFGEAGLPTPGAVHWPSALACLGIGLILARRAWATLGARAGAFTAVCLLGSFALIERPTMLGFDALTGLFVVGALDRAVGRSSDWVAGLWAALAILTGGWPALAVILLPIVVLGRQGSYLSHRLLLPPVAAFVAWSGWALTVAPGRVWGEALFLPLKLPAAWWLAPIVAGLALPWSPMAMLVAWPSTRRGWDESGRRLVLGWLQVAGASALAGTLIPGLATAAFTPTLAGLALAAAAGLDGALRPGARAGARRTLLALATVLGLTWAGLAVPLGTYLAAAVPYYRPAALVLVASAIVTGAFAIVGAWERRLGWAVGILLGVAIGIKMGHAGIWAPEWNYRVGQGPWGRAIGQWVPPRWPIYVFDPWPADLAFAAEHPFRQLASPRFLEYEQKADPRPAHVLIHPAEFEHWPEDAPKIRKLRTLQDAHGRPRVLARTEGSLVGDEVAEKVD